MSTHRHAVIETGRYLTYQQIKVFPIKANSKSPLDGFLWKDWASNDPHTFHRLFPAVDCNLAIKIGPDSGILDIEPDDEEANQVIERLMAENGIRTVAYSSRRGIHRLFRWTPLLDRWGTSNPKAGKLECRLGNDNKSLYSLCPPSIHPDTGQPYLWLPGCAPWETPIAEVPPNIIQYFIDNVRSRDQRHATHELDKHDDGWLPGVGGRHSYLLSLSRLLYSELGQPRELAEQLTRTVSQYIGSYSEEGRGEVEIKNLFAKLNRKPDHLANMHKAIDMGEVSAFVQDLAENHSTSRAGVSDEIPSHIFHPALERASQWAKFSQLPRNLYLMSSLTASAFALGAGVKIRVSEGHEPMGLQLYTFGVGGSGTGKSRVLKAQLSPFLDSARYTTEATPEALVSLMANYPRGIMLALSEGKDFQKMLGKYSATGQTDNSLFHKCWSGDSIVRSLQSRSIRVEDPFLCVCAGIQKINLNQMPVMDCLDGLLQRMIIFPNGDVVLVFDRKASKLLMNFRAEYDAMLRRLASVRYGSGEPGLMAMDIDSYPALLTLDSEAQDMWEEYSQMKRSAANLSQWPEDHPHRADVVRHAEIALRMAGTMFYQDYGFEPEMWNKWNFTSRDMWQVPASVLRRAIDFSEWNWAHKQNLVESLVESAFATAVGSVRLLKNQSIPTRFDEFVRDRKRRMSRVASQWTLRDYYTTFRLSRKEAQAEVEMMIREGYLYALQITENLPAQRYAFLEKDNDNE